VEGVEVRAVLARQVEGVVDAAPDPSLSELSPVS
jgi:hypothetical protein